MKKREFVNDLTFFAGESDKFRERRKSHTSSTRTAVEPMNVRSPSRGRSPSQSGIIKNSNSEKQQNLGRFDDSDLIGRTGRRVSCVAAIPEKQRLEHDLHPFGANNETVEQHRRESRVRVVLPIEDVYDQIYRAKAQAKTVSTVDGCLYIDYKFVGLLPPGFRM